MAFVSPASDGGFSRLVIWADDARMAVARVLSAVRTRVDPLFIRRAVAVAPTVASASRPAKLPTLRAPTEPPRRLTLTEQWAKVTSVLTLSVDGALAVQTMQAAAMQQLDLAQYGLSTLVDELSAVMTVPGRRSIGATVHTFGSGLDMAETRSTDIAGQALAA